MFCYAVLLYLVSPCLQEVRHLLTQHCKYFTPCRGAYNNERSNNEALQRSLLQLKQNYEKLRQELISGGSDAAAIAAAALPAPATPAVGSGSSKTEVDPRVLEMLSKLVLAANSV